MFRRSLSLSLVFSIGFFLLILMLAVSLDVWVKQKMPEMRPGSIGLIGLIVAWIPISFYFQIRRRVLTPLRELRQKFQRAGKDRLENMKAPSSKDEICDVVAGYNQMVSVLSAEREERQRYERERHLQSQLVALGIQADGLVHELASPLSAISTFAKLAAEGDPESAKRLAVESRMLTERLKRFMALFRERESTPVRIRTIQLGRLIADRIRSASAGVGDAGTWGRRAADPGTPTLGAPGKDGQGSKLNFQFTAAKEPIDILSDEVLLAEILDNLLRNASRHAKSKVAVEEERTDGDVRVTVTDDGAGISPQHAEKLFRPFFTTSEQGHGLGLFVSKLWAQALGGRLELASARHPALGGASFRVILPAKTNPE